MYLYTKWLLSTNKFALLIYFIVLNETVSAIFPFMANYWGYPNAFKSFKMETFTEDFLLSVLIAPPLETLIAQFFPFLLLRRFTNKLLLIYISSAFLFALGHTYSSWYMAATFFIGLVFVGLFAVLVKKGKNIAFWGVTFVHAFSNLIAVLYDWGNTAFH